MNKQLIDCKVVSTYFGPRRKDSLGFEDTISILQKHLKYELSVDCGRKMDTIIVNHQLPETALGRKESDEFLKSIDGMKTANGKIIVINRPWDNGTGSSLGSFNFIFEKFQDQYNYWLFTEDEVYHIKPGYLQEAVDQLSLDPKLAFVCSVRSRTLEESVKIGYRPHCQHGSGITKREFLKKIFDKYGCLPHCTLPMPKDVQRKVFEGRIDAFDTARGQAWYRKQELDGEVVFTNIYVQEGFKLADIASTTPYAEFIGERY